jgi:hypothetical protein
MFAPKRKIFIDRGDIEIDPKTDRVYQDFKDKPILTDVYTDKNSYAYVSKGNTIIPSGAKDMFYDAKDNEDTDLLHSVKTNSDNITGDPPLWEKFKEWYKTTNDGKGQGDFKLEKYDSYLYFVDVMTDDDLDDEAKKMELDHSNGKHYPDKYKTPLHETFSDESIYADYKSLNEEQQEIPYINPGRWTQMEDKRWVFEPSESQLQHFGVDKYVKYYQEQMAGSDSDLKLPNMYLGPNNQDKLAPGPENKKIILNESIDFFKP